MFKKNFKRFKKQTPREEYAIILDFLPNGYPLSRIPSFKRKPVAQAIGTEHFTLLELSPKKDVVLKIGEKVYIGREERPKIEAIIGRLFFNKLTSTAKAELEHAITNIIEENEERFVDFFNKAGPLSMRMHSIELIPGIGKKVMWEIIEKREEKPFESFEEMYEKIEHLPDLKKAIAKRIISELEGNEKHKLFVK